MEQLNLTQNVDSLFRGLEEFTQKEGIIGKPVVQGDKTFLPIVSISIGYGGGNAGSKNQTTSAGMSTGSGALGLGAKVSTEAVILIDNQSVSMLPVNSSAGNLMDKIPQIVSSFTQGKGQDQSQGQGQGQNQNQSGGMKNGKLMN
ncbi:hypothetical protein SDC9_68542 [bioreactor metagenome]|uniref:Sporulation protein YtfJ n=1 Tax=bioreactor metagenome TaxID=1076179 RepID=A0A644Y0P8_9ZZZZ